MKFFRFMPNDIFTVCVTTTYLLLYITLLQFEETQEYAIYMLLFFPVLVVWQVYSVLKNGTYDVAEPGNDEFGYQDKTTEELSTCKFTKLPYHRHPVIV